MFYVGVILFLSLFGGIFFAAGAWFERRDVFNDTSTAVAVRVVGNHEKRDSDGVTYAPEFEIVSGPHKGNRWTGSHYSSPPVHDVGDQEAGFYDEASGQIVSATSLRSNRLFNRLFMSLGAGILFAAAAFAVSGWSYR